MDTKTTEVDGRSRLHLELSVPEYLGLLAAVINLAAEQHKTDREKLADIVLHLSGHKEDPDVQQWMEHTSSCCPTGKLMIELAMAFNHGMATAQDKEELAAEAEECRERKLKRERLRNDLGSLFTNEEHKAEKMNDNTPKGELGVPTFLVPKGAAPKVAVPDTNLDIRCLNDGKRATIHAKMGAREAYAIFAAFAYCISALSKIPYSRLTDGLTGTDESFREEAIKRCADPLIGGDIIGRWFRTLADNARVLGEDDIKDATTLMNSLSEMEKG